MILETAMLDVRPGQEAELERTFAQVSAIISSMPDYVSQELQRCIERPPRYQLLLR